MSDAIAFEFRGRTVGVLARHGDGFIFYSGAREFDALDSLVVSEPRDLYVALSRQDDDNRRLRLPDGGLARRSETADARRAA